MDFLIKKARRAQRLRASDSDIRDLVFQSSVFRTGAAVETYIRLLIESWAQEVKNKARGHLTPGECRAFIVSKRLQDKFSRYAFNGDEKELYMALRAETDIVVLLGGNANLPAAFDGKVLHQGAAYPSNKNIKKLFARVGIDNILGRISANLSRDAEVLIESFQSVRTALAHAAPPTVTIGDVEKLLGDSKALVGSIDRIFYKHVAAHGGRDCWTS
ncbi:hypothetical protein [Hyphomicrobium sp. 802]|uniref:hypothetical protein n=1 Tax=Hyphomicrobium sp. 802 TaxID=1112272 RepID=UPI0012DF9F52|nr:hypothetical protein [Hyphomicrobium sp. 802]